MDVKLLEEITERSDIEPIRPAGFGITYTEFARANYLGDRKAKEILTDLVASGALESRYMRYRSGRGGVIYYKPGAWPPKE